MCLIVDINTLSPVFDASNVDHPKYAILLDWIVNDKMRLTVGGTGYMEELARTRKFLKIIVELKKAGKAVEADRDSVDQLHNKINQSFSDPSFNDRHIVALTYVSGAKVLCTNDFKLSEYTKARYFYNKNQKIPKIYGSNTPSSVLNSGLLQSKCRLCKNLT